MIWIGKRKIANWQFFSDRYHRRNTASVAA